MLNELYNAFTDSSPFIHTFSTEELPAGVYYLNIIHNGVVRVENVVITK